MPADHLTGAARQVADVVSCRSRSSADLAAEARHKDLSGATGLRILHLPRGRAHLDPQEWPGGLRSLDVPGSRSAPA